ncbi:uncharacterized protein B0T15DRAFT_533915 [Chaetomium strumarium]|uniref:Lccl domain-containing protein n=1 Tax=Chaetomium strumarium TaxID=1170767 RepID=A0AAJ0GTU4_9PEZI|nr:hypothetical protein B0T15DRAFT_533915 [Chaetomium strumarium]
MSAPASRTIHELDGSWVINKKLSDDMDPLLEIQGIPWILRKAISWATITGTVTQTKEANGCTLITVAQTATGGIKGETEYVRVDGAEHRHNSQVFGTQLVRTRWLDLRSKRPAPDVATGEQLDPYLRQGWLEEETEGSPGHVWITSSCEKAGWRVEQVWGFALVDGQRYHVKRFVITKGEQRAECRMVYDWVS